MNQILSVEMPSKGKSRKTGNKASIKSVITFFCIVLIIFAAIMAGIGIYMVVDKPKDNPNENEVIPGTQANIDIEVKENNTLNIIVTHDQQISSISYKWNDEEPIVQENIGQTNYEFPIEIPEGKNTLVVTATDINGVTTTTEPKEYGETLKLTLEQLEENGSNIKITAQSNVNIAYISYNWDGQEEKQIQVNSMSTEQILEASEGEHTLNVVVVDSSGVEKSGSITIIAKKDDTQSEPPVVDVTTDGDNFIIRATDQEGLSKILAFDYINQKTIKEQEINGDKQYELKVPLNDGENKIVITVYDIKGKETIVRKMWKKTAR